MRRTALAVIAVAALALALAAPAGARSEAADAKTSARGASAEHRRIVDYWTAERRASAKPRDIILPLGAKAQPRAKPSTGGSTGDVLGSAWTRSDTSVAVTTGKVFFNIGASRYVCSGSSVQSTSESLVLTAGHCAHGGGPSGKYFTNWIFYPRYKSGPDQALGTWTATKLVATEDWVTRDNAYENDAAFAKVTNGTATTLQDHLAAYGGITPGIEYSTPASGSRVHAFGYPASGKYNGTSLIYCSGLVSLGYDGQPTQSIPCNMTGGSSGGPWFQGFDASAGGGGVLNSVNSYGYQSIKNRMFGPIFDTEQELKAFTAANS